jgi:hypothetical protein
LSLLEMPRLGESHGYKGPAQDNLGTMVKWQLPLSGGSINAFLGFA